MPSSDTDSDLAGANDTPAPESIPEAGEGYAGIPEGGGSKASGPLGLGGALAALEREYNRAEHEYEVLCEAERIMERTGWVMLGNAIESARNIRDRAKRRLAEREARG